MWLEWSELRIQVSGFKWIGVFMPLNQPLTQPPSLGLWSNQTCSVTPEIFGCLAGILKLGFEDMVMHATGPLSRFQVSVFKSG